MTRVCVVLTSRAQYGRSKILLRALKDHPALELQIVVAGSALLPKYGDIVAEIEKDQFTVNEKITMLIEGGSPVAMSKTTGLGLIEFTTAFENLKPDIVIIRGDRYEMLAAAIASSYLNILIAHIEGGDLSGTIDESVRHSITKLAHIHFPTNADSAKRIRQMGEHPDNIHNVGSLDVEFLDHIDLDQQENLFALTPKGLGPEIDFTKPYLVILQHPVTTEYGQGQKNFEQTTQAIDQLNIPAVWFWPNVDAGNDEISKVLRVARESKKLEQVHFFRSLPPEVFIRLLNKCSCLVGNSSSGIKESSYLGVPVVNIGSRQTGRLRAQNVKDVPYRAEEIKQAIQEQLAHGRYAPSKIYYQENSSRKLADLLAKGNAVVQKRWVP